VLMCDVRRVLSVNSVPVVINRTARFNNRCTLYVLGDLQDKHSLFS
jgi:hypothetical protein